MVNGIINADHLNAQNRILQQDVCCILLPKYNSQMGHPLVGIIDVCSSWSLYTNQPEQYILKFSSLIIWIVKSDALLIPYAAPPVCGQGEGRIQQRDMKMLWTLVLPDLKYYAKIGKEARGHITCQYWNWFDETQLWYNQQRPSVFVTGAEEHPHARSSVSEWWTLLGALPHLQVYLHSWCRSATSNIRDMGCDWRGSALTVTWNF